MLRIIRITLEQSGNTGDVLMSATIADMLEIAATYTENEWSWDVEYVLAEGE